MAAEQGTDDYPYARRVAEALGVETQDCGHRTRRHTLVAALVYHNGRAGSDPAVFPTYLISKLAREDGTTVLLSGTGGDEMFFGYEVIKRSS